jgi:hypothetical protein
MFDVTLLMLSACRGDVMKSLAVFANFTNNPVILSSSCPDFESNKIIDGAETNRFSI